MATRIKKVLVLDRPYVKRSAWVGTESLPHVFYENFKSFSQREFPIFKTREEAMDWLVDRSKLQPSVECDPVKLYRLSFECDSSRCFVSRTIPKIWVHSETMLPTTCPHFELGLLTREEPDPSGAGNSEKDSERVVLQESEHGASANDRAACGFRRIRFRRNISWR